MNEKYDVVALGELLIDFTENGKSDQGNPVLEVNPGGAPCNVLAMLKKLGHEVCFVGKVGEDSFGDFLADTLKKVGISKEGLSRERKVHTTLAFVHKKKNGDRDFSFYRNPGADVMLRMEDVQETWIRNCKIFHFGSLSMTDKEAELATVKALNVAANTKKIISFDPNLREPLWENLQIAREKIAFGMSRCHILKISDNEIQWFTGKKDYREGVRELQETYPNIQLLLLSLGEEGSMAFCGGTEAFVPAYLQENTVETTGAGDTFCGCILHEVLKRGLRVYTEEELQEMLRFANVAASIVTTRRGALCVMPTEEEIKVLL